MLIEKIVIPKKVLNDTFQLNKQEYTIEYSVKKQGNEVLLYPKTAFLENRGIISAYELAEQIRQQYGKCVFVFFEEKESNIEYFLGQTEIFNDTLFLKDMLNVKYINNEQHKISNFIDMLMHVIGPDTQLIVFNINVKQEIIDILLKKYKPAVFSNKEVLNFIKNVKVIENNFLKFMPFAAGIIIVAVSYFFSLYYVQKINNERYYKIRQEYYVLRKKISSLEKQAEIKKKKIAEIRKVLSSSKTVYKGQ